MVRVCGSPPTKKPESELALQDRFVDVLFCKGHLGAESIVYCNTRTREYGAPFSIRIDHGFSVGADGVVSKKTIDDIGYNGVAFSRTSSCPGLSRYKQKLVRKTWQYDCFCRYGNSTVTNQNSVYLKCAPFRWILRRPNTNFKVSRGDYLPRYPSMTFIKSRCKEPRYRRNWEIFETYE